MTHLHVRHILLGLALALAGCGGGGGAEPGGEDTAEAEAQSGGEDEAALGDEGDAVAEPGEEEAPTDDGMRCLAVAQCGSFANQSCALVDANGAPLGPDGERMQGASVEEACPGERGVDTSVSECFEYIESQGSCRRRPAVRAPEWPCARTDEGGCDIQM